MCLLEILEMSFQILELFIIIHNVFFRTINPHLDIIFIFILKFHTNNSSSFNFNINIIFLIPFIKQKIVNWSLLRNSSHAKY